MRPRDAEYGAAPDETMEIRRRWAREGRTDGCYKSRQAFFAYRSLTWEDSLLGRSAGNGTSLLRCR
jgi:hypothetical protein